MKREWTGRYVLTVALLCLVIGFLLALDFWPRTAFITP